MASRSETGRAVAGGMGRPVQVHCYSGHRGEQTPRRFVLDGRRIEVVEVEDAWLGPEHRFFKVTGDDGFAYLLCHGAEGWRLGLRFPG